MTVVDEIKERIDIADLVGETVPLRKSGRTLKAPCPFHQERTPSFVVDPGRQRWHCFGACSEGGDIFSWVMKKQNVPFREALRQLAEQANVPLRPLDARAEEVDKRLARLRSANEAAATFFRNLLLTDIVATEARLYVDERGVSDEISDRFALGYAPNQRDALQSYLSTRGFTSDDLVAAGLVAETEGGPVDRFRDRLVFPIRDSRGRSVGFGGRALGSGGAKYLNTAQTLLFDKSRLLYGLPQARDAIRSADQIIIVEGYMDVIAAHQHGQLNVVASMGTALTEAQVGLIKPMTRNIVLALDADTAGAAATLRGIETTRSAVGTESIPVPTARGLVRMQDELAADIRIIEMPAGRDPDDLIRLDPALWSSLVEDAPGYLDYRFRQARSSHDLQDPRARGAVMEELLPLVQAIGQPVVRAEYMDRLAVLTRVDVASLQTRPAVARRSAPTTAPQAPETSSETARLRVDPHTEFLLKLVMTRPEVIPDIPIDAVSLLDDGVARELLSARISGGPAGKGDAWSADLEPRLLDYVEQLTREAAVLPPFSSSEARQAARQALDRLRERRLREAAQAQHQDIAEHERALGVRQVDDAVQSIDPATRDSVESDAASPALSILRSQETGLELHARRRALALAENDSGKPTPGRDEGSQPTPEEVQS